MEDDITRLEEEFKQLTVEYLKAASATHRALAQANLEAFRQAVDTEESIHSLRDEVLKELRTARGW